MSVKMVFVLEDGTRLNGGKYWDIDDAGGDFKGDAWTDLCSAAEKSGIEKDKLKLKEVVLEYEKPEDMAETYDYYMENK